MLLGTALLAVVVAASNPMNPEPGAPRPVTQERALLNRGEASVVISGVRNENEDVKQPAGERALLGRRGSSSVVFSVQRSRGPVDGARAFLGR